MIRILHFINNLSGGGAEKFLYNLISSNDTKTNYQFDIILLNSNYDKYSTFLRSKKINIITIQSKNPFKILFNIYQKYKKYDIIHAHLFPSFYYLAIAKIFFPHFPKIVFTEHSTFNRRRKFYLFKWIEWLIYNQYSKIICISVATKRNLLKWININKNKLEVIYNGIDLQSIYVSKKLNKYEIDNRIKKFDKLIILIGRFTDAKNHRLALDIINNLDKKFKLIFVGEGELQSSIKYNVDKLNLNNRVIFTGFREDVYSIINIADIILIPSKWEGFGIIAVEALSLGKQIVCSNIEGLKEVVKNQAFKVNSISNSNLYVKQIYKAIKKPKNKLKMIKLASRFDIRFSFKKYLNVYKRILNSK